MSEANRVETDTVKKSLDEIKDLCEIKITSKEVLSSTTLKLPSANAVFDQQDKTTNPILAKNNEVSQEPVKSAVLPSVADADKKQPNTAAAAARPEAAWKWRLRQCHSARPAANRRPRDGRGG